MLKGISEWSLLQNKKHLQNSVWPQNPAYLSLARLRRSFNSPEPLTYTSLAHTQGVPEELLPVHRLHSSLDLEEGEWGGGLKNGYHTFPDTFYPFFSKMNQRFLSPHIFFLSAIEVHNYGTKQHHNIPALVERT